MADGKLGEISVLTLAFQASKLSDGKASVVAHDGLVSEGYRQHETSNSLAVAELGRALLFGRAGRLSAPLGRVHPQLRRGQIDFSNRDAINSVIQRLSLGRPKSVPEITTEKIVGSVAVFGGPVASLHTRLVLGCGAKSPLLGADLPVMFDCSPLADPTAKTTWPWRVVVQGRESSRECLLITSLPMDDDRLTVLSGLHSAGTRAIDLALKSEKFLEDLHDKTRSLTAWQAVVEVSAQNGTAKRLGAFKVFEVKQIDFSAQHIRARLFLSESQIGELMGLLPIGGDVDLSDPLTTGMKVVSLNNHRLWQLRRHGMVPKEDHGSERVSTQDEPLNPRRPDRRSRGEVAHRPRKREVRMNKRLDGDQYPETDRQEARRPPGRPPKEKSEAVLTRRLQIMLSDDDVERIRSLKAATLASSMGDVIREAVRRNFERFSLRKPQKTKS